MPRLPPLLLLLGSAQLLASGCGSTLCMNDLLACKASCQGGDLAMCNDLAFLHETGRGVEKDRARAVELYEAGCAQGDALACTYLASMSETGRHAASAPQRAIELYKKGCAGGVPLACTSVARLQR